MKRLRFKYNKKVRVIRDQESVLNLRGELQVAYCLLNDRRMAVAYEPYASAKRRGPDYAVTYRANLVFNIEVTRTRAEGSGIELPHVEERILRLVCSLPASVSPL